MGETDPKIVERLRNLADLDARSGEPLGKCMRQAAATIERLSAEVARLTELADKYMWQVRDTCARAERAEAEVADLRARLAQAVEALEAIRTKDIHPYVQIGDDPNFAGETVMVPGQYSKIAASALASIKEPRT